MKTKLPKILVMIFLIVFAVQLLILLFLLVSPDNVQAADDEETTLTHTMLVKIPGVDDTITFDGSTQPVAKYIQGVYKYAVGIVGILAAIILMYGGAIWLTAGGNASRVEEAKAWIGAALTGLVLTLTSYTLLFAINPDLVNFTIHKIEPINKLTTDKNCSWKRTGLLTISVQEKRDCSFKGFGNEALVNGSFLDCGKLEGADTKAGYYYKKENGQEVAYICCCGDTSICPGCSYLTSFGFDFGGNPCKGGESECQMNTQLANKLKGVQNNSSTSWRITEAYPPTVQHISKCHSDGTCVDIALKRKPTSSNDCDEVKALIKDLQDEGLKVLNEYSICGGTTYETTTGGHLHVAL